MYQFNREEYNRRIAWFRRARFGMFIHWGLYAIPARGEWVRSTEEMPEEEYMRYFREFNPDNYDPRAWAKAAKEAGCRYVVLTAKHHDGFCLFDSKYTDFKATNTRAGRDLIREYVDAVRAEGLKVGLYYSLIDWHHPDFPQYQDRQHPMRNHPECSNENRHFERYLEYMHGQVRELMTNYGKIDLLWLDFSYDDMRGEKWSATKLADMVRTLQPGILINNRMEVSGEGYGSIVTDHPLPYHGDFVTPEQMVPPDGIRDAHGRDVLWESCVTMNGSWGYTAKDHAFKSAPMLIHKLVECVSKGGNMILNVGPDAKGNIPQQELDILAGIGAWMKQNSASVYNCGRSDVPVQGIYRITEKSAEEAEDGRRHLYFHLYENAIGPMPLPGVCKDDVEGIRYLATGAEVPVSTSWVHSDYPDVLFADLGSDPELPDPVDTVLDVVMK